MAALIRFELLQSKTRNVLGCHEQGTARQMRTWPSRATKTKLQCYLDRRTIVEGNVDYSLPVTIRRNGF
jgi:hypothetical protein